MSRPAPFPWDEALRFALGRLGWSPDAFWSATPRELALAIEAHAPARADAPTRADLAALMAAFPD